MSHPESCKDPNCELSYREHLLSVSVSGSALPTRGVNRTEGQPDEPLAQTVIRERRWERDIAAYKRLRADGYRPPRIDGSALREREGKNKYDIEQRPVTIDHSDASTHGATT